MAVVAGGLRRGAGGLARGGGRFRRGIGAFLTAVRAVMVKELRGRMRGRRAFVVLTVYLLLLGAFAFGVYLYVKQTAGVQPNFGQPVPVRDFDPGFTGGTGQIALSATIGHALFSGLVVLETLLVLVLAPAFTTGAISLEREKQTLELLVTTPLSTLGMVIGKLLSALVYVFLLILASIPFASIVFPFGGVGPEDLVRAYVVLFALAFGMGAIGLFVSALVRRTQTATVLTFVLVLTLTLGTAAAHEFWRRGVPTTVADSALGAAGASTKPADVPEALLWLNPFVSDMDLICTTAPSGYDRTCSYMSGVTRKPYFGAGFDDTVGSGCIGCVFPEPGPVICGPNGCKPVDVPVPLPVDGGGGGGGSAPGKPEIDPGAGAGPSEPAVPPDANGGADTPVGTDAPSAGGAPDIAVDLPAQVVTGLRGQAVGVDGGPAIAGFGFGVGGPGFAVAAPGAGIGVGVNVDPTFDATDIATFGYPRDTFWPHSTIAFLVIGVALTLLSAQLVAPTRRARFLRVRRPSLRRSRRASREVGTVAGEPLAVATVSPETDATSSSTESLA